MPLFDPSSFVSDVGKSISGVASSATGIAIIWFVGAKVSTLGIFKIDALWPSLSVSAVLYFAICLAHKQTPEEAEKAELFFAARGQEKTEN